MEALFGKKDSIFQYSPGQVRMVSEYINDEALYQHYFNKELSNDT